jgi:hypothetical protein
MGMMVDEVMRAIETREQRKRKPRAISIETRARPYKQDQDQEQVLRTCSITISDGELCKPSY